MPSTIAFDIYGTLIDTAGVTELLRRHLGDRAPLFSQRWREKQLEYSFRRALMQQYLPFPICTRDALHYTCSAFEVRLTEEDVNELLEAYRHLPAFDDVRSALQALTEEGYRLYAFSNGVAEDLTTLLRDAGIEQLLSERISVDEIGSFKPDPAVYRHFLQRAAATADESWLISSNPFDILGAMGVGMNTAWIQRDQGNLFDPWGAEPTVTLSSLKQLPRTLADQSGTGSD